MRSDSRSCTTRPGNAKPGSSTSVAPTRIVHQQLVEPVVERERQHAEDALRLVHPQVLDDRVGGEGHVAVRQRHALGIAGRSGRVDDRGEVDADRSAAPAPSPRPALSTSVTIGTSPATATAAPHDLGVVGVADDRRRAGVRQDVRELVALDRRVERRECRARAEHAVDRDRRLDAVRQHDGDPVAALDAELAEAARRARRPAGRARRR